MARVFISPSKYVQGAGELDRLGEYTKVYGKKALVIISAGGKKRFGERVEASLTAAGVECAFDEFNGECSQAEIDRLVEVLKGACSDVVLGVGGGKIFDTAKAVAAAVDVPVVVVPTIAATDAPCSALCVIYTGRGRSSRSTCSCLQNPNLVLVDTEVIAASSPVRLHGGRAWATRWPPTSRPAPAKRSDAGDLRRR